MRPDWDEYFMKLSEDVATRSTCPRASMGVALTKGNRLAGVGYNGAPSGLPHCIDVGCKIVNNHCVNVVHAEVNAIINAMKNGVDLQGSTLYCAYSMCYDCAKIIINAGIKRVVYKHLYIDDRGDALELMSDAGIVIDKLED